MEYDFLLNHLKVSLYWSRRYAHFEFHRWMRRHVEVRELGSCVAGEFHVPKLMRAQFTLSHHAPTIPINFQNCPGRCRDVSCEENMSEVLYELADHIAVITNLTRPTTLAADAVRRLLTDTIRELVGSGAWPARLVPAAL